MGSVAKMTVDPQSTILEALSKREYLPLELMKRLGEEKQLTDASLKSAILDLLREMRIEFGPDQKLRIRAEAPVVR
jgi:hypothetical protein